MIRRDIQLVDEEPCWLLISQVEHARISGVLAEAGFDKFSRSAQELNLCEVREELLSAITHHDDGWAAWEAEPGLDDQGRPLSFRELPLDESIPIWDASIESAARYGALAEYIVMCHFLSLLESSDKPSADARVKSWKIAMSERRRRLQTHWQAIDPRGNCLEIASASLGYLQLFDLASLWLCSMCPGVDERIDQGPETYQSGDRSYEFSWVVPDGEAIYPAKVNRRRATFRPWPFVEDELAVEAKGWIAPVCKYRNGAELRGVMARHEVRWLLTVPSRSQGQKTE